MNRFASFWVAVMVAALATLAGCQSAAPHPAVADSWSTVPFCRVIADNGSSKTQSLCSGTLVDANGQYGLILTCRHCTVKGGPYHVRFPNGKEYDAVELDHNDQNDISALRIKDPGIDPVICGPFSGKGHYKSFGFDGDGVLACIEGDYVCQHGSIGSNEHSYSELTESPRNGDSGSGTFNEQNQFCGVLWGMRDNGNGLVTMGKPVTDEMRYLVENGKWVPSSAFTPGGKSVDSRMRLASCSVDQEYDSSGNQLMGLLGGRFGGGGGEAPDCPSCRIHPPFAPHADGPRRPIEDPTEVSTAPAQDVVGFLEGLSTLRQAVLLGCIVGVVGAVALYFNSDS